MPAARSRRGHRAWTAGHRAEAAACAALQAQGWRILARRVRTPAGEIDIIAQGEPALLAFIEVKARPLLVQAAHCLSARQQRRLIGAATILLARNPGWLELSLRFDLILVDAAGSVRRIADAFRVEQSEP